MTCWKCKTEPVERQISAVVINRQKYKFDAPITIRECQCGMDAISLHRVDVEVRSKRGLLTGDEIRKNRIRLLGRGQRHLAALIGVSQETVSRWESMNHIQTKSADLLMRLVFDCDAARNKLRKWEHEDVLCGRRD